MKKIFIFIFLTKIAYAMDPQEHFISSDKITKIFNNDILKYSNIQFNLTSKNHECLDALKMKMNLQQNPKNTVRFFQYGPALKTFVKRLLDIKHLAMLNEAKRYNLQNNIALETDAEWNNRASKNKKKYTWLRISSKNEKDNFFAPVTFFNAFNNAINQDNPNIEENIFKIQIHIDKKPYEDVYHALPDFLKNLLIIHNEKIAVLVENLQINDIDEYEQMQNNIVIQKENEKKELEAKKRKEIEEWVNKKKAEYNIEKTEFVINIIKSIIENLYLNKVQKQYKRNSKISIEYDLNILKKNEIIIGERTKNFLNETKKLKYINIFTFVQSLISLILQDSNNQDQIKSIEYDLSKEKIIIPSYIAAQQNELFMWRYNLITTNLSTSEKKSLGSDYSYTRDDLVEITVHMQNVKTTELEPYIKQIIDLNKG
jgi:hypothetical protein